MGKSFAYKERRRKEKERGKEEKERLERLRGIDEEERRGNVLLWSVIENNDDICFQHILPRLNWTDIKFLYGVNTETRNLIKRSSRTRNLKEWYAVKDMSSISALELAWKHYYWGEYEKCD